MLSIPRCQLWIRRCAVFGCISREDRPRPQGRAHGSHFHGDRLLAALVDSTMRGCYSSSARSTARRSLRRWHRPHRIHLPAQTPRQGGYKSDIVRRRLILLHAARTQIPTSLPHLPQGWWSSTPPSPMSSSPLDFLRPCDSSSGTPGPERQSFISLAC